MASIFILFPKDNAEFVSSALQHFQWAVERFETMAERNRLAASARGVLHAIQIRLKKALGVSGTPYIPAAGSPDSASIPLATNETPSASSILDIQNQIVSAASPPLTASASNDTRGTSIFTTPESVNETYFGGGGTLSGLTECETGLAGAAASDWTLPEDFDWGSIQPVYAMADVAYNDLMGISSNEPESATGVSVPNWAGGASLLNNLPPGSITAPATGSGSRGWSFEGDFGADSVWSLLNQFSQF